MREEEMDTRKITQSGNCGKLIFAGSPAHARWTILLVAALAAVGGWTQAAAEEPPADAEAWIDENVASLVELYRHWHQSPELSFAEVKTAARLAEELRNAGAPVTTGGGGAGGGGGVGERPGKG